MQIKSNRCHVWKEFDLYIVHTVLDIHKGNCRGAMVKIKKKNFTHLQMYRVRNVTAKMEKNLKARGGLDECLMRADTELI